MEYTSKIMVGNTSFHITKYNTMKKYISYILTICTSIFLLAIFTSCDDDKRDELDLSGSVNITSFKANGVEGVIDESSKPSTIQIYLPWSYDLTNLKIDAQVSAGAVVSPGITDNTDLSASKTYRVINGNLYNDYSVSASYSKILTFTIDTYSGTIDNDAKTITVKYPIGEGLTALKPKYTATPGATVSPSSGSAEDFTNPVEYTISYMGESVVYTVTVVPTNFSPVGFLGTAASSSDIENEDEKAAYDWFVKNVPNAEYISFSDIKSGTASLSKYSVLWWHLDGTTRDLPAIATSSDVLTPLKSYLENGGSFFLSSWAVKYAASIGATKDGKEANNLWGETNGAEAVTLSEDWGICFTGHESHAVFTGLSKPAGVNNKVYLLSSGLKVRAHNALWNFAEDWVDYKSKSAWEAGNGGVGLASFQWDDANSSRAVMFEYPKSESKGGVICFGGEAYDWAVVGTNKYQSNLEKITSNIIDYLQQ